MVREARSRNKKVEITLDEFKSKIKTADLNTFFIFGAVILVLIVGLYAIFSPTTKNLKGAHSALDQGARVPVGVLPMYGAGGPGGGRQVVFGFGKQAFICPACNWRLQCTQQGNTYPNCPNCGLPMAKDMSNQGQGWWSQANPFSGSVNTAPLQNNLNGEWPFPVFWQRPESTGFFICPQCNWRMYAQIDQGQFPRCPNCRTIMAGANTFNQNFQNAGFGVQGGGVCILR
ncbi:MAG: hypothetical protein JSW40_00635 [Candidatus Omnitrophota bacterium]|nr:MAG: hypothetical protein JSW40_00635 [Candidatus Omnitrophota bacterium]